MQDPTDPETFDEYLADEHHTPGGDHYEASEADAAEQRHELLRLRDTPLSASIHDAANPADAAEQSRVVDVGDDEYER